MECKHLVEALQAKIKSLELDVQYNLHMLEQKTQECERLKEALEGKSSRKILCPMCNKESATLVGSAVKLRHCEICHREWPNEDPLPHERRCMGDEGEIRH